MAIKMIVTDLDGTFYHKDLTYDKKRFDALYEKMVDNDIRFVVASGNQYYQLISFFDHPERLTFVSENGGYIVKEGKELFSVEIPQDTYHRVVDVLKDIPNIPVTIICGKTAAYVLKDFPQELYDIFVKYFPRLVRVDDFHQVDDQMIKFALQVEEEMTDEVANKLLEVTDDSLSVVTSGHGSIDLIVKGIHKGNALKRLMSIWDIKPEEVMAFGDAMNDKEMLKLAGYGFVMANGNEVLKQEIGRVASLSNEEDGELEIISEYFENPEAFLKKYR